MELIKVKEHIECKHTSDFLGRETGKLRCSSYLT